MTAEPPEPPRPPEPPSGPWGPPPGYGPPPGQAPQGYGPPPGWYPGPPQTSTKAVIALILAIAAYTPIVPFVGAVIALVLSRSARADIEASGGRQTGLGLCTAATVLSVVHLVFIGLLVLLLVTAFALPFSFSR